MIDYIEKHNADGTSDIYMASDELPRGYDGRRYTYTIRVKANGWCECKSRSNGPGSTRYSSFRTLEQSFAHGIKWAKRKIREAKVSSLDLQAA